MKISNVIAAWHSYQSAQNRNKNFRNGSVRTDGSTIWSYNLIVGYTTPEGQKVVIDYTSPAGYFQSMRTSSHVGAIRQHGGVMVKHPDSDTLYRNSEYCPKAAKAS